MNVVKHGTSQTKDSEKIYKVTCDSCGCVFEAKRSEFHVWPLPARPVSETVRNYDNTGRPAEIQCPECKCTCGIRMRLLARESAFYMHIVGDRRSKEHDLYTYVCSRR